MAPQIIRITQLKWLVLTTNQNSEYYYYTSYKLTDQFLWFQVQMNSYSRNWNTPYLERWSLMFFLFSSKYTNNR